MTFTRRPRMAPTYRGEGQSLRLSGIALILVGVVLTLASLAIFGFESVLFYVFFAVAAVMGAVGLRRNYLGGVFTEIEGRLDLPAAEK